MKNKVEHIWSVLCTSSSTDKETNRMSLFDLVDQLNIESLPKIAKEEERVNKNEKINIPINLEIVSFIQRLDSWSEGDLTIPAEIEIIDPKGITLNTGKFQIIFPKGFKRLRYRTKINGIAITLPGEYFFKLKIDNGSGLKLVSKLPLDVKIGMKFE